MIPGRVMTAVLVPLMFLGFASCGPLVGKLPSFKGPEKGVSELRIPPGFHAEIFARDVTGARSMTQSPNGTLFVGTRDEGNVYAIDMTQHPPAPAVTIATGLHQPNGVAFRNGSLYVAEVSRILRMDGIEVRLQDPPDFHPVTSALPDEEAHGWKILRFGPDGKLYFGVGMPCNTCEPDDERFGSIMRCDPDGTNIEIFARGVRNTLGIDWEPRSHILWFTENGRDWLGDDLPPDELNNAPRPGLHFGFPYCYGKNHADPDFKEHDCSPYVPALMELGAHVATLGMRFYNGKMFPQEYQGGIFIAEHGSWNRSTPVGYRVMFARLEQGKPVSYSVFAEGWLDGASAWGRPVDIEILPDGSLLVSDDKAGVIYRFTYADRTVHRRPQE